MSSIFIGAMLQPLAGTLLDWHAGSLAKDITMLGISDFRAALWILPVCSLLAVITAFFLKETYCSPVHED